MEVIKRKILLEEAIDRNYSGDTNDDTWGTVTATTFYLDIQLNQTMDDMGLFTDINYLPKTKTSSVPDYTILIQKLEDLQQYVFLNLFLLLNQYHYNYQH